MSEFTIDELVRLMRICAGETEGIDLDGDITDIPFDELGYDSLALLEVFNRVKHEFGAEIPEEMVGELKTPRMALTAVRDALAATAG
ncbi:acyl carrier protein [Gandjariella thermophila]|uniref:Actinorhodin polyketide synthase acyl carrier protein n=1 Tax=Gandjariella thermophila TaxID=1931992 RepID=A0A4D4JD09_9PSEU|nr:acyl carrier protein [Gandjariella thermophila]GDY31753.1 actinorhodin polyketide synthase acyl carrier protein [Gandjariella thermophila]